MTAERHLIVAGAGIAGLTAALALARAGMRVTVFEQAEKLADTGAGIQLSPNATRVLIALGLREKLAAAVMTPQAIRVMAGGSGREVVRIPLGAEAESQYGAPYWVIHRGDLQSALATAANAEQDIRIKLGVRVADFAGHTKGITVLTRAAGDLTSGSGEMTDERGFGLVGADGLWSTVATRLRGYRRPRFAHRTAWRALIAADSVPDEFREPVVYLWLGLDAHLVHYPVKGGRLINIVGIVYDEWKNVGWSAAGDRNEVMRHFARWSWSEKARALVAQPDQWLKWALYDRKAPFRAGDGAVTLIGDAAHPMLPFLAQGAAMAIEDAAVLGAMLARYRDDPTDALRAYEGARWHRVARAQQASRKQGGIYGLTGPEAAIRNLGMRLKGGEKLRDGYDWLYSWRPPELTRSMSASA